MTIYRRITITNEEYASLRHAINNLEYDVIEENGQLKNSQMAKESLNRCKLLLEKIDQLDMGDIWEKN